LLELTCTRLDVPFPVSPVLSLLNHFLGAQLRRLEIALSNFSGRTTTVRIRRQSSLPGVELDIRERRLSDPDQGGGHYSGRRLTISEALSRPGEYQDWTDEVTRAGTIT